MNRSACDRVLLVGASPPAPALAAALTTRRWAVEAVDDADEGLRRLTEHVDGFDLLLVCLDGHRDDGDLLVRTVRRGGESRLAVVVVAPPSQPTAGFERAGADAVLDRSLGIDLIARASEAVLSRKRARG